MKNMTTKILSPVFGKLLPFATLFLLMLVAGNTFAQNPLVTNTLSKAKQLRNEKKFTEAATVLGNFEKKYPGNLWVEQMYAQTLFWMKDYRQAEVIYKRAIGYHPDNPDLKYDYAVMLFAENKLDKAKEQLLAYSRSKRDNAGVVTMLGKIYYYQAQFKQAEKYLGKAVKIHPGDKAIENLYREVFRIVSPQLSLSANYLNDDQPLQSLGSTLKFQWYLSGLLHFNVWGNSNRYTDILHPGSISTAGIGNRFHFRKAGVELYTAGAWFYAQSTGTTEWGGTVSLLKNFKKNFKIEAKAERTNYSYTIASVNNNLLMVNQISLDFTAGKSDSWNGMAGTRYQFFPDDNYVSAFYAWFLSKPLKLPGFNLALGYAFNYMDSKEDRFEPKYNYVSPNGNGNGGNNSSNTIDGVYIPYYTPHNQYANSVLVNFNFHVAQHAVLYGHASVGVFSKTYAPGYYSLPNTLTLEKSFSYQNYTPLDLGLNFQTDISRKASLSLSYTYLQTYYYSSHNVNFVFRYYF